MTKYTKIEDCLATFEIDKNNGADAFLTLVNQGGSWTQTHPELCPKLVAAVLQVLKSKDPAMSNKGLAILQKLCPMMGHFMVPFTQSYISRLVERFGNNRNMIRRQALVCVLRLAEADPANVSVILQTIKVSTKHRSPRIRACSIRAFGQIVRQLDPQNFKEDFICFLPELVEAISDTNSDVRKEVTSSLSIVYEHTGLGLKDYLLQKNINRELIDKLQDQWARVRLKTMLIEIPGTGNSHGVVATKAPLVPVITHEPLGFSPLPLVVPLVFPDEGSLETVMHELADTLKDRDSRDWLNRLAALKKLSQVFLNGSKYPIFFEMLAEMKDGLVLQVTDLRSMVCKQVSHTLRHMAVTLKEQVSSFADFFIPCLLTLVANKKTVIADSGNWAIRTFIQHCRVKTGIVAILQCSTNKMSALRCRCMEYLELVLQVQTSDQHLLQHGLASQIASKIETNVDDASPDVRKVSRRCICALETLFPDMANSIKVALSKSTMRLLQKETLGYTQRVPSKRPKTTTSTPSRRFKRAKLVYEMQNEPFVESYSTRAGTTEEERNRQQMTPRSKKKFGLNSRVVKSYSNPETPTFRRNSSIDRIPKSDNPSRNHVTASISSSNFNIRPKSAMPTWNKPSTDRWLSTSALTHNNDQEKISLDFQSYEVLAKAAGKAHLPSSKNEKNNLKTLSWKNEGASITEVSRVLAHARKKMDYSALVPYERNLRVNLENALHKVIPGQNEDFRNIFYAVCDFVFGIQCTTEILTSLLSSCIVTLGGEEYQETRTELLKRLHDSFTVLHSFEAGTVLQEIISETRSPMLDKMCIDFAQMALDSLKSSNTRLTQIAIKNYNRFIKKLLSRYSGSNKKLLGEITKLVRTMDDHVLPYQRTALGTEITEACSKLSTPKHHRKLSQISETVEVQSLSNQLDDLLTPSKGKSQPQPQSDYSQSTPTRPQSKTMQMKEYTYPDYDNFVSPFSKLPGPEVPVSELIAQLNDPNLSLSGKLRSIRTLSERAGKGTLDNSPMVLSVVLKTIASLITNEMLSRNVLRIAKRLAMNYRNFANGHVRELLELVIKASTIRGQELLSLDAAEHLAIKLEPSIAMPWLIAQLESSSSSQKEKTKGLFTLLDQFLNHWNPQSLRECVARIYKACSCILQDLNRGLDRPRAMRLLIKLYMVLGTDSSWILNPNTRKMVTDMAQKPQFINAFIGKRYTERKTSS